MPIKPCDACKRKDCPKVCYPLKDWKRAVSKRKAKR